MELAFDAVLFKRFVQQVHLQLLLGVFTETFGLAKEAEFVERCLFVEGLQHGLG
jgi:hypothetical protein